MLFEEGELGILASEGYRPDVIEPYRRMPIHAEVPIAEAVRRPVGRGARRHRQVGLVRARGAVSPPPAVEDLVAGWPVTTAAVAVVTPDGVVDSTGPLERSLRWASVTKVLTAMATWVALEEGTLELDQPAGPPGSTVRHLLAHASGVDFETDHVHAPPGKRRIYSNTGFEVLANTLADAAGIPFTDYLGEGVLEPLDMTGTILEGSPAAGAVGPVGDLARLAVELLAPTLVSRATLALATTVTFPGLDGVLPGFGRQSPNDWGLGVELHGTKAPHWMPPSASPATFGHFGQAGGFVWVDPTAGLACACLTDRDFGAWSKEAWPPLGEAVLSAHSRR